jgi:hypothetical protein
MEPVTTSVTAKAGTEAAELLKKEADSFLAAVLGEPARAFGGLLADKVNARRHANLIQITVEAKRKLDAAGVSPKEVPLKIIHPMLEAASLEEDPDLQARWANLLATAADPRRTNPLSPSFTAILKELTAREAHFLDSLLDPSNMNPRSSSTLDFTTDDLMDRYVKAGLARVSQLSNLTIAKVQEYGADLRFDLSDFAAVLNILTRNGILMESVKPEPIDIANCAQLTRLEQVPLLAAIRTTTSYYVTELGSRFVSACRPFQKS